MLAMHSLFPRAPHATASVNLFAKAKGVQRTQNSTISERVAISCSPVALGSTWGRGLGLAGVATSKVGQHEYDTWGIYVHLPFFLLYYN